MDERYLAGHKKKAEDLDAWIVFLDEAGISQVPPLRRTWSPVGLTPVLEHPFHWQHLSICVALAYRGSECRELFQVIGGSYNAELLIKFLRGLKRAFPGQRVILIWDNVKIHKQSREMKKFLAEQIDWLESVYIPPYAPELNPVEYLFGNVKGTELANRCSMDIGMLVCAAEDGLARVRDERSLIWGFLEHTGLPWGSVPSG